jgi:hypothetical protein
MPSYTTVGIILTRRTTANAVHKASGLNIQVSNTEIENTYHLLGSNKPTTSTSLCTGRRVETGVARHQDSTPFATSFSNIKICSKTSAMANTADTPYRRWAKANFTTSFLYPLMVSRAISCLLPLLWHLQSKVTS